MSIWRIWGETGRIIAILCLTTALAAVTAAVILLVHEDLTERLSDRVKRGIGRKTGILALVAVGVWILVIGQSVAAAEVPANSAENSTDAPGNEESGTAEDKNDSSGAGSTSNEIAPEAEPGTNQEPGTEPAPEPDVNPPEISIQMMEQITAQMARAEGVTEELKDTDQMKWVGLMNNIRQTAEETVLTELIYN